MHAYLIVGADSTAREAKINEILGKKYRRIPLSLTTIDDARYLKKITSLSHSQKTAYLLENFEKSSHDAQNALLKNLEEPSPNVVFAITTDLLKNIPATITSRCQVNFLSQKTKITPTELKKLKKFFGASEGRQLLWVSRIRKREDALAFLDSLLYHCQNQIQIEPELKLANLAQLIIQTITNLHANANVSLQLTKLVIDINHH